MKTYEELKQNNDLKVKDWFTYSASYGYGRNSDWREDFAIEKETEKAVLISFEVVRLDGEAEKDEKVWVPKSCFESYREYHERKDKAFEEGCNRYNKLIAFCKENKIKGARVGLRVSTLLEKIENAGLSYNY